MYKILLLFNCLLMGAILSAQEYSYVHYEARDGLAGNTVYDLCQDKDGFIWFATESGVSRYDGTHFKNFTTADGLPDTEILRVFADSRGRIWMAPFKNTVCYYYQGKIFTQQNDSALRKVKMNATVHSFGEDLEGNIVFASSRAGGGIYVVKADGKLIDLCPTEIVITRVLPNFGEKGFVFINEDWSGGKGTFYTFIDEELKFWYVSSMPVKSNILTISEMVNGRLTTTSTWKLQRTREKLVPVGHFKDKTVKIVDLLPRITTGSFNKDKTKVLFVNTYNGSWLVDTLNWKYEEHFLKGKKISAALIDNEKNTWFATFDEGVYKLVSREFKTWHFANNAGSPVFSLEKFGDRVFAGSDFGRLYSLNTQGSNTLFFDKYLQASRNQGSSNRLLTVKKTAAGNLLLGFDSFLAKYNPTTHQEQVSYIDVIKSLEAIGSDSFLVGTGRKVLLINSDQLSVLDTIWPYRSTAAGYYNNAWYIGTGDGVFIVSKNKTVRPLAEKIPTLRYRTAAFAKGTDGTLWIATNGGGLVQMKGDQLVRHLTTQQGLTSDICRTLFVRNKEVWVGTDKGLNKINTSLPSYPVTRYSTADGLPSDIIQAIYVDSSKVYVGSPIGLTIFDESRIASSSRSDLTILDISVSGQSQPIDSAYRLSYKDNNLKISFVAISFRSAGDILYRYRLKGLKDSWDSTRQTVLEYPSLPSGDYQLELIAINKFGVASTPVSIPISIAFPFWQTTWFRLLMMSLLIGLIWAFISWRLKRIQKKLALQKRMNELEQLALRAQMNPHFIFNCLNSIQNFIINKDLETTNEYLTGFARLIRQTLDNSSKETITIEQEISYLSEYLELEKMRFGHSFEYRIEVDPAIETDAVNIPPMVLQPYVENSIRHGLRYNNNKKGLLAIQFERAKQGLVCTVEDNGIGRKKAAELKSTMHVEYQSKGMSLTAERINGLNRDLANPITIDITDLEDDEGQPTGTRIVIHFPNAIPDSAYSTA